MRLTLVPWEPTWLVHQTLDLKAIYRRPQRDKERYTVLRDDDGFIRWDLTAAMTIRNHIKYLQKGFEYVTLATDADVARAADDSVSLKGAVPLFDPQRYIVQPDGLRGPWNLKAYHADQEDARQTRLARIEANIEKYGPDGAEAFERQIDPGYRLPERYLAVKAKRGPGRPAGAKNKPKPQPEAAAVV